MKRIKALACFTAVVALAFCMACGKKEDQSQKAAPANAQKAALSPEAQKVAALLPDDNTAAG